MADLSALRAEINETELRLRALQEQLAMAEKQGRGEDPVADSPADESGQDKAPPEDDESSYADKVNERLESVESEEFDSDALLDALPAETKAKILQEEADAEAAEFKEEQSKLDTTGNKHLADFNIGAEDISADPDKAPAEPEPELDYDALFETVHGERVDESSSADAEKMKAIKDTIASDSRLKELASSDPERFALYMYGRKSVLS